ncbi:cytochrome c biogenesis protein CcsA [Parabacteroides sp. PF5-9]|uniref:cytochrome c biogenesis protein CcsA n=1 Tax=Parabacteroides sp. PF5-9 TaxID=1742404 RepID=UPI0024735F2B|nr:cytochrome c biogenesis protein CcsA [Parabacteroides sp. PF5-9]MDH6357283.1 ABC-type transport system involved in cytochrome c biogenesis permease subunit [Parabacteroides sp. PF5-9]
MTWNEFGWFAVPAMLLWITAGVLVYTPINRKIINLLMVAGILVLATFIGGLWIGLERPPLRTMGETRLWYSFFLSTIGYLTFRHWKYKWLLSFSGLMACVFVCINLFKPEIHSKNLMPALQSIWFVPHVTSYILSYAMLGAATIASFIQIHKLNKNIADQQLYRFMDNLVYVGFGFLMLGLLMGCVWAKEAWGHYWSWDPKETWAFITSAAYLVYIHMRLQKAYPKLTVWVLPIAFILLMITWIGVNYLPSAQGSIHTYS